METSVTNSFHEIAMLAPMLYVPADRPDLAAVLGGERDLGVCSIAVCLEDAVRRENRNDAAVQVCRTLEKLGHVPRPVFIRPADEDALERLLENLPVGRIAGFILPKATVSSIHAWTERSYSLHTILPIMETREVLDPMARRDLALACAAHPSVIPGIRIGANDLFRLLGGLRRPPGRTIYETPVGHVIDGLLETFCAHGIGLCAPVSDRVNDLGTLLRELEGDVQRGLFSKTAVHPKQVHAIWAAYMPAVGELAEARQIVDPDAPAVFGSNGDMLEPACHGEWARRILRRAELYRLASQSSDGQIGSSL
jgi:citrate lyase beta subunit